MTKSGPPLERLAIDSMRELIAVLDRAGTIITVNRAWREAAERGGGPAGLAAGVGLNYLDVCRCASGPSAEGALRCHAGMEAVLAGTLDEYELEYPCPSDDEERWFLLRVVPLRSDAGGLVAIHTEMTQRERLERGLARAARALRLRSECSRALLGSADEGELLARVCRAIVDTGGYRYAWVGFAGGEGQQSIVAAARAGAGNGCPIALTDAHGQGAIRHALRAGGPFLVRDMAGAAEGRAPLQAGCGSFVALPLAADGVRGGLNVYAPEPNAFVEDEIDRLMELAGDLAMAVSGLRARAEMSRMQAALAESARWRRALLDSIPDMAWLKDRDSRYIAVNDAFGRACGWAPEALVGGSDFDVWPEDLARHYVDDDAEVMRTARRKQIEERLVDAAGRESWIETIKTPILGAGGEVVGTSGIARDVTERRRIAQALQEEKAFSDTMIRSLPGLFYVFDGSGAMVRWNERLAQASGYDAGEIRRMNAIEFVVEEDRQRAAAAIRRVFEEGYAEVEVRLRTRSNAQSYHLFTGALARVEDRTYLVGVAVDIDARQRAETALRESERRLQAIISSVPVILFGIDTAGVFTLSEGKGLALLGLEPGEVVGRSAFQMYADHPRVIESLRGALEGRLSRTVQMVGDLAFDVLYMPVTGDEGAVSGLIGVAVDITERRRAELELERSHARLRMALAAAKAGAWSWDSVSNLATWSDENYLVMGIEPGSCPARYENWLARVHPEDRVGAEARVIEAMANRTDLNAEFRVVWPDGSIHWINDVGRMVFDARGEPAGMYGIQIDITERKLAAEALERSEQNLRITLRSIGDAVIATGADGRVTLMNPVAEALTGWTEEQACGRPLDAVFRIINEETRAPVESPVRRVLAEGIVVGLANHTLLIDRFGVERPIADSGAPIRFADDGPVRGVVLVFRDQTEERRVRRRLEEEEAKYRSLVQQVPAVIYLAALDAESSSLFVSGRVEEMLGYTLAEYAGDPGLWLRSVHPDDRAALLAELERSRTAREPFRAEYRVLTRDGREIWISDVARVVAGPGGEPAFLQGLMFDVTERKRAEREVHRLNDELERRVEERTADLAAAVRELESFSYTVSHDLRAPLRAINGYSSLLLEAESSRLGEQGQALLHRVIANTIKMERLIDDILQYSRAGRQPFETGEVNLEELAQGVVRELGETYPSARLAVHALPTVKGDQTMLRQVFANLIGNALKFSAGREQPSIEIGTRRADGEPVFYVSDNGVGFDMHYAGKLFGMFQRMHRDSDFPGTGVGLALVKRLVERHRGRVWAEAEPDRGATFFFTLPQ
jgi:PAS domain S-box-containing protein